MKPTGTPGAPYCGRESVTFPLENWAKIDAPRVLLELARMQGVYLETGNILDDNRQRIALGLPIVRRGKWKL